MILLKVFLTSLIVAFIGGMIIEGGEKTDDETAEDVGVYIFGIGILSMILSGIIAIWTCI